MYPFRDGEAVGTFRNILSSVLTEINSLENEYILKASETELLEYYINKATIEPLVFYTDQQYIKNQESTEIDVSGDPRRAIFGGGRALVSGTRIEVAIPFEGDPMLWKLQASTFSMGGYPDIQVLTNEIIISFSFPDDSVDTNRLKSDIGGKINSLQSAVGYLKNDVTRHNESIESSISQSITRKKELALSTTGAVAALGIPVKK